LGPDAEEFNPRRFQNSRFGTFTGISEPDKDDSQPKKVHPAAFRTFGGGTIVCPGRHFAQTELLALTAGLVLGFNITGADGGPIVVPPRQDNTLSISMPQPAEDVSVKFERRNGWRNVHLKYSF
jgi:cytochrome P450